MVVATQVSSASAAIVTQPLAIPVSGFQDTVALSGLVDPTAVRFAADGRVFVAEKSGLIKVYATLEGSNYTILADLRPRVQDFWDRGLLGMELDPATPNLTLTLSLESGGLPTPAPLFTLLRRLADTVPQHSR